MTEKMDQENIKLRKKVKINEFNIESHKQEKKIAQGQLMDQQQTNHLLKVKLEALK